MKPPIIIIGAGRSGTKLMRDLLCLHRELTTWPCDEINPIWRYDNPRHPHDELRAEHATARVKKYIRGRFARLLKQQPGSRVVEKTCANSLRVEYVRAIFPGAQFIHLVRDGRDVAASARRRWTGRAGLGYVLGKARFVPARHVPYQLVQFSWNRLSRLRRADRSLGTWGPRFDGMDALRESCSLLELCGVQWERCLRASRRGLRGLPSDRLFEIRYETLVMKPVAVFEKLLDFLRLDFPTQLRDEVRQRVKQDNVGKWRRLLDGQEVQTLVNTIGATLAAEGYIPSRNSSPAGPGTS